MEKIERIEREVRRCIEETLDIKEYLMMSLGLVNTHHAAMLKIENDLVEIKGSLAIQKTQHEQQTSCLGTSISNIKEKDVASSSTYAIERSMGNIGVGTGHKTPATEVENVFTIEPEDNFKIEKTQLFRFEEYYSDIMEFAYSLSKDSYAEYKMFPTNSNAIYPRIISMPGSKPEHNVNFLNYGFLDHIYPSIDLREISKFDDQLKIQISKFAQNRKIYLKFYSISPEINLQNGEFLSPFHIISIGHVTQKLGIEPGNKKKYVPYSRKFMEDRRSMGIHAVLGVAKNLYERKHRGIMEGIDWILVYKSDDSEAPSKLLEKFIQLMEEHKFPCSRAVRSKACAMIGCHGGKRPQMSPRGSSSSGGIVITP